MRRHKENKKWVRREMRECELIGRVIYRERGKLKACRMRAGFRKWEKEGDAAKHILESIISQP